MPFLGIYTKIITHEGNQQRLQPEVAGLADEEIFKRVAVRHHMTLA